MRPIPAYKAGLYGLTENRQLSNANPKPAFIPVHRTGFSACFNKFNMLNEIEKYYQILGLHRGASKEKIIQSYEFFKNVWHPGQYPNDPITEKIIYGKFREVCESYHQLINSTQVEKEGTHSMPDLEAPLKSEKESILINCLNFGDKNIDRGELNYRSKYPLNISQETNKIIPHSLTTVHPEMVTVHYAGIWSRLAALFIDLMILGIGSLIFNLSSSMFKKGVGVSTYTFVIGFDLVLLIIIGWIYHVLFESSSKQATLGKMAVGIIVTNEKGKQISYRQESMRFLAKIISILFLGIGCWIGGFTRKRKTLHDMIAKTIVTTKSNKLNKWVTIITLIVLGIIAAAITFNILILILTGKGGSIITFG